MNIEPLWRYIQARQEILLKRKAGISPPWTSDPILSRYSFCNVYREDDRTTIWCKEYVRDRFADLERYKLALAIAIFRNFNRIETGDSIFDTSAYFEYLMTKDINVLKDAITQKESPYFTGAYIIRSENGYNKLDGVLKYIPVMHKQLIKIFDVPRVYCMGVFHELCQVPYVGTFMAAQLIADFKYTKLLDRSNTDDWNTFAAMGPGSRRGLNIVLDRHPNMPWSQENWHDHLLELRSRLLPGFAELGWEIPHAQDVQNQLCEFAKYTRGSSRKKYP